MRLLLPVAFVLLATGVLRAGDSIYDQFVSVQISSALNELGSDTYHANTPSIALNPLDENNIVVGWRGIECPCTRHNAFAYSHDGGQSWTENIVSPNENRSLPVLAADGNGVFYYHSLRVVVPEVGVPDFSEIYKSIDGGMNWILQSIVQAGQGNEYWLDAKSVNGMATLDFSGSTGVQRSLDGGQSFEYLNQQACSYVNTQADGGVWSVSRSGQAFRADGSATVFSTCDPIADENFALAYDGKLVISTDKQRPSTVYILAPTRPTYYQRDLEFVVSNDGGQTWKRGGRINDDIGYACGLDNQSRCRVNLFADMSVAPNGRIDVCWVHKEADDSYYDMHLRYSYSIDGGISWMPSVRLTNSFVVGGIICGAFPGTFCPCGYLPCVGPHYYNDMESTDNSVHIVYAGRFNTDQYAENVYYLKLPGADCHLDDWDQDGLLDEDDDDDDGDGVADEWDVCPYTPIGAVVDSTGSPLGDGDQDCFVGVAEVGHFDTCFLLGGPQHQVPTSCFHAYSVDGDADVDLADFAGIQRAFYPTNFGCNH